MFARTAALASILAVTAIAASPAFAACDDRPGTPTRLTASVISDSTISLGWTNTRRFAFNLGQRTCWDIEVRDGRGAAVGKDVTGGSCVSVMYGAMAGHRFQGLDENKRYCFRVRARTEPGTEGCVSQIWAGPVCATTAAAPAPKGGFAALAANGKGFWGYAVGQGSEAQARDAALKGCGQADCKIAIAGQNRCIAYYESRKGGYWYGLALGATPAQVLRVARSGCTSGAPAGSCRLVKQLCS